MSEPSPVTIVISRTVLPGREAEFEKAVREFIPQAVMHPGHEGVFMLHPLAGSREYGAVLRFKSREMWSNFETSKDYQAFLNRIQSLLESEPNRQVLNGLEAWFPWSGSEAPVAQWKMAVATWLGVCLTVGVVNATLGKLVSGWNWFISLLAVNAVIVAALTWLVMPAIVRLIRPWLQPPPAM